jgi:hypothetical protein
MDAFTGASMAVAGDSFFLQTFLLFSRLLFHSIIGIFFEVFLSSVVVGRRQTKRIKPSAINPSPLTLEPYTLFMLYSFADLIHCIITVRYLR